jgi:hypothetical protein
MEPKLGEDQRKIIEQLLQMDETIEEKEKELKCLKADRAKIEAVIRDFIIGMGFKRVVLPSGTSISPSRQIYASKVAGCDMGYLVDKVREAGLDEFVATSVNPSRVSAWLREREKEKGVVLHDNCDAVLPDQMRGLITVWEKLGVSIRKGR